jgi:hypothetical protein
MAPSFQFFFSKTKPMPNQGNRSNGSNNSGKGQTGDATKKASAPKPNPERSDKKHGSGNNDGDTGRTSNQGRKAASGGSAED